MIDQTQTNEQPYDKAAVQYIRKPYDDAWEKASAIAGDTRFSAEHRQQQVHDLLSGAAEEIQARSTRAYAKLDAEHEKLTATARVNFGTPSAEDAPRMIYMREILLAQSQTKNEAQLYETWQGAIDDGDQIAARVFADFMPGELSRRHPKVEVEVLTTQGRFAELQAATISLLSTDEQRAARQKLPEIEETKVKPGMSKNDALHRLRGARIQGDTLVSGLDIANSGFARRALG